MKRDRALPDLQFRRAGPVHDVGLHRQQRGHLLEIGQGLLDIAIDHAEKVEGRIELDQIGVDQHEVANRHFDRRDAFSRQDHHANQPDRNDRALTEVQQG